MNESISFPRLVKRIRTARGLTQEQLARALEVTFATVNCWENGRHHPIPSLARKLLSMARAEGIPLADGSPDRPALKSSPRTRKR